MKTRETEWFNEEHAKLLKDGRSWGNAAMYQAKMECLNWCMELAGLTKDMRILDVGCGTGELAAVLKQNGYTTIDGIDISAVAIEHAAKSQSGLYLTMDFTKPVRLGTVYDCIYDTDCLHMVINTEDRASFLRNVRGNLRDKGILLAGVNSSRECVDPYVELDGVVQFFWPRKEAFLKEILASGFDLVASRDLPPRNKKRCEMWSEVIFRKNANQVQNRTDAPAGSSSG